MTNYIEEFKNGSGIYIKKKNKGKFTDFCGGKVTEECIQRGKHSKNPLTRKRATFAANARRWKHEEGGIISAKEGVSSNVFYKSVSTKDIQREDDNPTNDVYDRWALWNRNNKSNTQKEVEKEIQEDDGWNRIFSYFSYAPNNESQQSSTGQVRSYRNYNPGNIRKSADTFIGEIKGDDKDFKTFQDNKHGFRAMFKIYKTYIDKGINKMKDIVSTWAPAGDGKNNPDNYIKKVTRISGITPDEVIDSSNQELMMKLANAMALVESGGIQAKAQDIAEGWDLFTKT